jgi:hypothetical protein
MAKKQKVELQFFIKKKVEVRSIRKNTNIYSLETHFQRFIRNFIRKTLKNELKMSILAF